MPQAGESFSARASFVVANEVVDLVGERAQRCTGCDALPLLDPWESRVPPTASVRERFKEEEQRDARNGRDERGGMFQCGLTGLVDLAYQYTEGAAKVEFRARTA